MLISGTLFDDSVSTARLVKGVTQMIRLMDLIFSGLAILALSPALLVVIAILKVTGEGEIFFSQKRVGVHKKPFRLLKFATMLKNSESMGSGTVTIKNDPRVLPFGKFLRKTKINELPQLFNIFLGDMSVIGPRPLHNKQFSFYTTEQQNVIASVRPGLSGVGSIIFRYEEALLQGSDDPDATYRTRISPRKAALETWFVENRGLGLYFRLILLTIIAVVFPSVRMDRFFTGLAD